MPPENTGRYQGRKQVMRKRMELGVGEGLSGLGQDICSSLWPIWLLTVGTLSVFLSESMPPCMFFHPSVMLIGFYYPSFILRV